MFYIGSYTGSRRPALSVENCPMICPMMYAPVCTKIGRTFASKCNLDAFNCEQMKLNKAFINVEIDYYGECKTEAVVEGRA